MKKYEFSKYPLLATLLAVAALVFSVFAIASSLLDEYYYLEGVAFLGLVEVVAAVLIIAGLTTGRTILLKVISIIITVSSVITMFILTIVKFETREVELFAISLLMLIAGVLGLVYYFSLRNPKLRKIYIITSLAIGALVGIYTITYAIKDIYNAVTYSVDVHFRNYLLLLSFGLITVLPMVIYRSLTPVENKQEESLS